MKLVIIYRNGKRFVISNVVSESLNIQKDFISYRTTKARHTNLGDGVSTPSTIFNIDTQAAQVSYAIIVNQVDDIVLPEGGFSQGKNGNEFVIVPVLDDINIDSIQDGLSFVDVPLLEIPSTVLSVTQ